MLLYIQYGKYQKDFNGQFVLVEIGKLLPEKILASKSNDIWTVSVIQKWKEFGDIIDQIHEKNEVKTYY